jgi:cob(I)alamin adenosyltransferase
MTDAPERRKAKMIKRKAAQDALVAAKPIPEKGLLIVHTGPGKGKSTAAFGLATRALGRGFRVGVVQFIKGTWSTGERAAVERFGAQVEWRIMGEGFTWETHRARRRGGGGRVGRSKTDDGRSVDPPPRAQRARHRAPL